MLLIHAELPYIYQCFHMHAYEKVIDYPNDSFFNYNAAP